MAFVSKISWSSTPGIAETQGLAKLPFFPGAKRYPEEELLSSWDPEEARSVETDREDGRGKAQGNPMLPPPKPKHPKLKPPKFFENEATCLPLEESPDSQDLEG